jgi:hypothetical protein
MQWIPYIHPDILVYNINNIEESIAKKFIETLKTPILEDYSYLHQIIYSTDLPKRIKVVDSGDHNPYHLFFYMIAKFYYVDNGVFELSYYYSENSKYICNQALEHLPSRFIRITKKEEGYEYIQAPSCDYRLDLINEHWVYNYVKNLYKYIWESTPQEKGKRIYISRNANYVNKRAVLNEDKLIPVLKELGISSYSLENITFIDTVRLFKSAEFVTGYHGAGLAWLIFCDSGTKVLEIYKDITSNKHYIDICEKCNLHLERFINIEMIPQKENIIIDIPSYSEHIQKICKV